MALGSGLRGAGGGGGSEVTPGSGSSGWTENAVPRGTATGDLDESVDANATFVLGRAKVGYDGVVSDYAWFGHYDRFNLSDAAIGQSAAGDTYVQAAAARTLYLRINGTSSAELTSAGVTVPSSKTLTVASDTDATTILGRARIDSRVTGQLYISHYDSTTTANYMLGGTASSTSLNGASNAYIRLNGTVRLHADATGLGFFGATPVAKPEVTGAHSSNAALQSLLTALANLGLITDSSS